MMYRNHGQIDRGRTNLGQSDQGNISHINQSKIGVVESVPKIEESSKVSPPLSYVLRMMSNPILMWLSDHGNISHVNQSNLALVAPAQF
nr:MAG TPA: hypothetical protein [Caudoviricetes sp.]